MYFVCGLAHFGTRFESIRAGVGLSPFYRFRRHHSLRENEIVALNATKCKTPRVDNICTLAHCGKDLDSIGVSVKLCTTSGSNRYYKLHARKIKAQNETGSKIDRMDICHALAHINMVFGSV